MEVTIEQALQKGVAAHKDGRLQEAERLYWAIIKSQPTHSDANHNLGLLAISANQSDAALPLFKTALEANPKIEQFWFSYIDALIKEKQFDNAKKILVEAKKQGVNGEKLDALEVRLKTVTQDKEVQSDLQKKKLTFSEKRKKQLEEKKKQKKKKYLKNGKPSEAEINNITKYYQNQEYEDAERLALIMTEEFPNNEFGWNLLGAVLGKTGRYSEALNINQKAVALSPQDAAAHHNLGITLKELGRFDEAAVSYKKAIALKPNLSEPHVNLATVLNGMGFRENALWHFKRYLQLERGTKPLNPQHESFQKTSKAKIDHDIEQFEYLATSGYDSKKFRELAGVYKIVASEIDCASDTEVVPLSDKHRGLLGDTYNRPLHILEAPLLDEPAIGKSLNINKITNDYFSHEFGLTYIDDFLSLKTLESLREFLLGSTIWFDFFHPGGYMGAYLKHGLASPLILQIAEDLRLKLPKIFKHHKLTQLWAYKYDSRARDKASFDGIKAHADMAAINVNFWITPKSANLDPSSGGLVVYNAEAPEGWDFKTYNGDTKKIYEEIQKHSERKTVIPYNENRAVIFNSNLFHETDNIDFKDGYENRRINVTMLFGEREYKK